MSTEGLRIYKVIIPKITDQVAPSMSCTHAPNERSAMLNVLKRIATVVQSNRSSYNKKLAYDFGGGDIVSIAPQYVNLLLDKLWKNPDLWTVGLFGAEDSCDKDEVCGVCKDKG